jgi:integrase
LAVVTAKKTRSKGKHRKPKRKAPVRKAWPRVTEIKLRGEARFLVDGRPLKERKYFDDKDAAVVTAEAWANERENAGLEGLLMPSELRRQALDAEGRLRPWGKTIADAVDHYVAVLEKQREGAPAVEECLKAWIRHKEEEFDAGHLAETTLAELRSKSKLIQRRFRGRAITEIDESAVEEFLARLPHAARGRFNIRTKLSQFLNFCRRRRWIDSNPAQDTKVRVPDHEVEILSVEECEELLSAATIWPNPERLLPYVAVGLFAGLRPGEARQLRWERVDCEQKIIHVKALTSKPRKVRYVEMEDALVRWLSPFRKRRGAVVTGKFDRDWRELRAELGYARDGEKEKLFPFNALRHSYGSYWLALHRDRARLAELMGNSQETIARHYRRPLPISQAEAFWALSPDE